MVHVGLAKLQAGFLQAIEASPDLSGLDADRKLRLADSLLTQYIGLRMLARSRLPLGVLQNAVAGVGDMLAGAARL